MPVASYVSEIKFTLNIDFRSLQVLECKTHILEVDAKKYVLSLEVQRKAKKGNIKRKKPNKVKIQVDFYTQQIPRKGPEMVIVLGVSYFINQ